MANAVDTTFAAGRNPVSFTVNVTRSQTSNTPAGVTLPAGWVTVGVRVLGPAASDAGGTATISVGSTNSTTGVFVSAFNVKTNGLGLSVPSSVGVIAQTLAAPTPLTVQYTESGTASTTGGPWTVVIEGFSV